jgi:hypothetical protein
MSVLRTYSCLNNGLDTSSTRRIIWTVRTSEDSENEKRPFVKPDSENLVCFDFPHRIYRAAIRRLLFAKQSAARMEVVGSVLSASLVVLQHRSNDQSSNSEVPALALAPDHSSLSCFGG